MRTICRYARNGLACNRNGGTLRGKSIYLLNYATEIETVVRLPIEFKPLSKFTIAIIDMTSHLGRAAR